MSSSMQGSSAPVRDVRSEQAGVLDTGWLACSAVLLLIAGSLNFFQGLFALNQSDYLVNQLLFSNLDAWGWTFVVWGSLQFLAGAFAFTGSAVARYTGVTLATIATVLWFLMIFAAPFAAILGGIVNLVIIYGLTAAQQRSY
ncbi:MAG: hypothetical protein KDC46_11965 [Thermoleophilia bacterium]|nr:hypothetical protein [Thermoleophilia bacterium]